MGELLFIIFGVLLAATVFSAPWLAAEDRREFLRPTARPGDPQGGVKKKV